MDAAAAPIGMDWRHVLRIIFRSVMAAHSRLNNFDESERFFNNFTALL
jgi:hypothetical protein